MTNTNRITFGVYRQQIVHEEVTINLDIPDFLTDKDQIRRYVGAYVRKNMDSLDWAPEDQSTKPDMQDSEHIKLQVFFNTDLVSSNAAPMNEFLLGCTVLNNSNNSEEEKMEQPARFPRVLVEPHKGGFVSVDIESGQCIYRKIGGGLGILHVSTDEAIAIRTWHKHRGKTTARRLVELCPTLSKEAREFMFTGATLEDWTREREHDSLKERDFGVEPTWVLPNT